MMDEVGEISYDDAAHCILHHMTKFHILFNYEHLLRQVENSDLTGSEQEANYIVEQVKDIINHQNVYDMKTGQYRKATYKDIVILERSFGQARNLQQAFKNMIP